MSKKILFSMVIIFVFGGFLSGCSHIKNNDNSLQNNEYEQKNTTIEITGTLSQNGELFFITDSSGQIHDIETYSVSFAEYVGKTVTVSGQYSGNTLFVTSISN